MPNLLTPFIIDLLPSGAAWNPEVNEGLDKLINGRANNIQTPLDFLQGLAYIRSPLLTPYLDDLEREYGIKPNPSISELQRRLNLASQKAATGGQSPQYLQNRLHDAGFTNLYVHENRPPVDPNLFLSSDYLCVASNEDAVAGNENAVAGQTGGELLVNGPLFEQVLGYIMCAGNENAVAGNENAVANRFDIVNFIDIIYQIPTDPALWGYFFFVGGEATRDLNGSLTSIDKSNVDALREQELKRLILKYKPVHTWAGLQINFI